MTRTKASHVRLVLGLAAVALAGTLAWLAVESSRPDETAARTPPAAPPVEPPSFDDVSAPIEPSRLVESVNASPAAAASATHSVDPAPGVPSPSATHRLSVTVVRSDGHVQARATVRVFKGEPRMWRFSGRGDDPAWQPPLIENLTDSAGSASLDLAGENVLVMAEDAEHGCSNLFEVKPSESQQPLDGHMTLTLRPTCTLHGRVLDFDGHPVPDATVTFGRQNQMPDEQGRARTPRPVTSGADGGFSTQLDPDYLGSVQAVRGNLRTLEGTAAGWYGGTQEIELRVPGAFAVTGLVLDAEGHPLAGAKVGAAGYSATADSVVSDGDGRFRLLLPKPTHFGLIAKSSGLVQSRSVSVTLTDSEPTADVTIQLERPLSISGIVYDIAGRPLPGALVGAHMPRGGEATAWADRDEFSFRFELGGQDTTDAEGRFAIDGLHQGVAYDLIAFDQRVSDFNRPTARAVLAGSRDVELRCSVGTPGTDQLRGRVIDANSRSALSPCSLTCFEWGMEVPRGDNLHVDIDSPDASFQIGGLDPKQSYALKVEVTNHPPQTLGPFSPSDRALELAVARYAGLEVLVVDAEGRPQPGAVVQAMDEDQHVGQSLDTVIQRVVADAKGRAVWEGLGPGSMTLEAVCGRLRSERVKVTPPSGETPTVRLTVMPPTGTGQLLVRVARLDGTAVPGVALTASRRLGKNEASALVPIYVGEADASGAWKLDGLAAGNYSVRAWSGDLGLLWEQVDVSESGAAEVQLKARK